jgi:hypothetical protein
MRPQASAARGTNEEVTDVIFLVHGTFAPNAPWLGEHSLLRTVVQRHFPSQTTKFNPFTWSGKNTHSARLQAAADLRAGLLESLRANSNARHFLICHSHGGNVALYAMHDLAEASRISGIVCMGTPFITCKPCSIDPTVWALCALLGIALLLLVFFLLGIRFGDGSLATSIIIAVVSVVLTVGWLLGSRLVAFILWLIAVYTLAEFMHPAQGSMGIVRTILILFLATLLVGVGAAIGRAGFKVLPVLGELAKKRQAKIIARLNPPCDYQLPVLCLAVRLDEARVLLNSMALMTGIPFYTYRVAVLIALIALFVFTISLPCLVLALFVTAHPRKRRSCVGVGLLC